MMTQNHNLVGLHDVLYNAGTFQWSVARLERKEQCP
jgi:hypothetical protein